MTHWLRWTLHHPYVPHQAYPGGFFTLFRPVQRLAVARRMPRTPPRPERPADAARPRARVERELDVIVLARKFNALLGALTCVILLGLAYTVTGSFAASVFAGLLAAWNPWHIEHAHYAETDIAMVFTLSIACWIWAWTRAHPRLPVFLLASLASGFAAGTKFPLFLTIGLVPVFAWRHARTKTVTTARPRTTRVARGGALTLAGVAIFLAGFAWANPAAVLAPRWFMAELARAAAGVTSETAGVIGAAHARPFARPLHQLGWIGRFLLAHGILRVALVAAVLGMLLHRRFRPHWRVTLLFPALYAL